MSARIVSVPVGIALYILILAVAPQPLGVVLAPLIMGAVIGYYSRKPLLTGSASGLIAYLLALTATGGVTALKISHGIAGPVAVLLPLVYYPLASGLAAYITGRIRGGPR